MADYIPKIEYGGFIPTVINFPMPPRDDDGEQLDTKERVTESLSGLRQVIVDFTEATRTLKFSSLSNAQKDALKAFFNSVKYGTSFKFYEDLNDVAYTTYQLKDFKFKPKKIGIRGENAYAWEVPMVFRRVLETTPVEDYLQQEIANNQVAADDIDDLILDETLYKSIKVFFEIYRKTSLEERVCNGFLTATYKSGTDVWDITATGTYDGDIHGVTFSVAASGQVQYTSDNMAGASYESNIYLRQFTIVQGI